MNFEDEQDLLILSKIYKIERANQIDYAEFQKIFSDTLGVSWGITFEKLTRSGIIEGRNNGYTTEAGIRKYHKLNRDKKKEETPVWGKIDWWKEQVLKWGIVTILAGTLGFLIGLKSCREEYPKKQIPQTKDTLKKQ